MGNKTRLTGALALLACGFVGVWEGLRTEAYTDIVGVETVCYGETKGVRLGDSYSKSECDAMLLEGLKRHETDMRRCLKEPDKIPAKSYVALVSLTYNIGSGAFCRSTAAKRLNKGDLAGACEAATWYNRAGGKKVKGLVNRRSAEYKLCMEGLK
ncbi:Lysozyme RrrD [Pseudovibrio axinellae]|uniref:Lysozyme n=1 Tax=Pseudovibrio axinellae TaxID=989403 RepID=A0A165XHJ0_9HYPH|nr:lysozyme [Pseudovibrio axinellae]KZL17705.1 Lysozyme RrrD [Pseudovibrio axinellae]SER42926.1 lysozyme [Pseudovibrio axinellae]